MSNKQSTKSTLWNMRATKADKESFAKLAKLLKVNESKAVRFAVQFAIKHMKKES